jgi:uncharacterized membrane protein YqaE (UPF0057 family)
MVFTTFFLPLVLVLREKGVGFSRGVVNLCETETVGQRQSLLVD